MRIGFDIDDVITDTSGSMKEYIIKYDKNGELMANIEDIMRGDASTPFIENFFVEHFLEIARNAKVKENAVRVLKKLLDEGNEIYLITARGESRIFNAIDKAQLCIDNHIDLLVDDSIKHCEAVRNVNINSILFTSIVNKSLPTTVTRVDNWLELEEKIKELLK